MSRKYSSIQVKIGITIFFRPKRIPKNLRSTQIPRKQTLRIIQEPIEKMLTEGDITGPGDGIPPEDIPGDIGLAGPTPAPV